MPGVAETPLSSILTTPMPATPLTGPSPANLNPRIQERLKFYADWLAKHARYDELNDNSKEINDYIHEATKIVKVGEKEVAIFAPFRPKLSALQTFTTRRVVALCVIGLLWITGLLVFRLEMLTAVIAAITVMYSLSLILTISMAARSFRTQPEEHIGDDIVHALNNAEWPMYTVLCPLYREAQVVPQFVKAMQEHSALPREIANPLSHGRGRRRDAQRCTGIMPAATIREIVLVPDGKVRALTVAPAIMG